MVYTYNASYVSMLGPTMAFREKKIMVTGDLKEYIAPGAAHNSMAIQMLNPPARFPTVDMNDRAFAGKPVHPAEVGTYNGHDGADAKYQLTADEYYLLILNADNGGQFYFRENAPGGTTNAHHERHRDRSALRLAARRRRPSPGAVARRSRFKSAVQSGSVDAIVAELEQCRGAACARRHRGGACRSSTTTRSACVTRPAGGSRAAACARR